MYFPLNIELAHCGLEGVELPQRALRLPVEADEVVIDIGADARRGCVAVELREYLGTELAAV